MVQKLTADGLKFHERLLDPKKDAKARESNLEATAKALIINFNGYKGTGDKVYIETSEGKKGIKEIAKWLNSLDTDVDGTITPEEVEKNGGDKFDILKLNASPEVQKKISNDIDIESMMGGMVGIGKGLDTSESIWKLAKFIVTAYTTKQGIKDMLSVPEIREYYNENLWGMSPDTVKTNARRHMKEVLQYHKFTAQDLEEIKMTPEQIDYFLGA